jgi:hypothetical protein
MFIVANAGPTTIAMKTAINKMSFTYHPKATLICFGPIFLDNDGRELAQPLPDTIRFMNSASLVKPEK